MSNNQFTIYDVGNLGGAAFNFFIGNTYLADNATLPNNYSTFLFASLTGGRNIRIDQATEQDPYIFIDARFYTFKPYSYYVDFNQNQSLNYLESNYQPSTNLFLNTVIQNLTTSINGDIIVSIKNLIVDSKLTFYTSPDESEIILKAPLYNLQNTTENKVIRIFQGASKDSNNNTLFQMRKLIEGKCITLDQVLEFNWTTIFSSFDSSSSSISSVSSVSNKSSSSDSIDSLSSPSSVSENSSSSISVGNGSLGSICCDDCGIPTATFVPNGCSVALTSIVQQVLFPCGNSSKDFIEQNYSFNAIVNCSGKPVNMFVQFPLNIYSATADGNFWRYTGTNYIDQDNTQVNYDLVVGGTLDKGITVETFNYTKNVPNLVQHDLTFGSNTYIVYNGLTTTIPQTDLPDGCSGADITMANTVFSAVEALLSFQLETAYTDSTDTLVMTDYAFPGDVYPAANVFFRDSVTLLTPTTALVKYTVTDPEYNSGESDAYFQIEVSVCAIEEPSYTIAGTLELTVLAVCPRPYYLVGIYDRVLEGSSQSESSQSLQSPSSPSSPSSASSVSSSMLHPCTDCSATTQEITMPTFSVIDNYTATPYTIPGGSFVLTYSSSESTCTWSTSYVSNSFSVSVSISYNTSTGQWSTNVLFEGYHVCFGFAYSNVSGIACAGGCLVGSFNITTPTNNCSSPDSGSGTFVGGGPAILSC